jgi:hypothetical protein
LDVDCHSSVAGGVKGNMICLSGGVPSADAGTVGVEAENLFSSFIARAGDEPSLLCCITDAGTRRFFGIDVVSAATWSKYLSFSPARIRYAGMDVIASPGVNIVNFI